MNGGDVLTKVKEKASAFPFYRMWMAGSSLVIMALASLSLWGVTTFINSENDKIAGVQSAVADALNSLNNHVRADIQDRETQAERLSKDEDALGRMEQNREDISQQIQSTSAARDRQFQSITDAIGKVTQDISEVRSQVSEIKGKLEYALPDRHSAIDPHLAGQDRRSNP